MPSPKTAQTPKEDGAFKNSAFAQQKISAWQPVLAPKWMIGVLVFFGILFLALGIVLIHASNKVVECKLKYDSPSEDCIESGTCTSTVYINKENCEGTGFSYEGGKYYITPPTYVYYALTNFYQNHRRYLMSRSNAQLQGQVITDASQLSDCEPVLLSSDGYSILTPCGLAAKSVFNDSYAIADETGQSFTIFQGLDELLWTSAYKSHFKNPDGDSASLQKLDQWLSEDIFPGKMENAHFNVWMRNAALPNFRKLYGKLTSKIALPITVTIHNRYPVEYFGGTKMVVLSQASWMGGKNPFLGIIYITLGTLLFLLGLFMCIKNRRDPRIMGDVRFLRWHKGKQA
eukprot:Blabericola_migrator_1__4241@NODE_22_length_22262_cov_139_742014_g19_i0_p8_GENE_NODE_22_length_22262_cov_139_742014_g19_i0NODE_22_length_22262_cov_139_742014_g19_i0_p8_ORF_typecomplete_len344_score47_42CDC50/PF03381_15/2_1e02CDC50/PF03381_15/2_6e68Neurensin/PF14927_6/0_82Neurensin/PF14927_6/39Tetraspanin/PF00335_20/18Tetraspanin/PF00335_20/2_1SfLAP/PF11139_8/34SfLAP/PF11139_8/1_4DUF1700/PF08006_11/12DUF1700/PF08006_11/4DUF5362/PF17319_2/9_8DUF5362/PF17319_2/4_5e03DUF5362/PF17319_2/20CD20/PF04103